MALLAGLDLTSNVSNLVFEEGIANLSFSLYGAVKKESSEFICPYSVSAALLLLSLGAAGTTEKQLMDSIFSGETPDNVHIGLQRLDEKILPKSGVDLTTASRLFVSDRIKILDSYKSDSMDYYKSETFALDFATQAEKSRSIINDWISTQTKNRIKDMIPFGVLNADTIMVLTNAVYFKGAWKEKFDQTQTQKRKFLVGLNEQTQVDMMYGKFDAMSGENTEFDCKILQLPYVGDQFSMVFVLPNAETGLAQLEDQLSFTSYKTLLADLTMQKTIIRIPKFRIEKMYDLKPILNSLGIVEIFDGKSANFTKMVPVDTNNAGVYVSDARQKTFLEVTEEGSEAAAATSMQIHLTSAVFSLNPPFQFVADHPFLFVIQENESRTILFIGRYAKP